MEVKRTKLFLKQSLHICTCRDIARGRKYTGILGCRTPGGLERTWVPQGGERRLGALLLDILTLHEDNLGEKVKRILS